MMQEYYSRRAPEYEAIYTETDPARKPELEQLTEAMRAALSGRRVLEVACGTGYWTSMLAGHATYISATDISPEMLKLAAQKGLPPEQARFSNSDAYDLCWLPGEFDGGLANFWLSHVPRARLHEFLAGFHAKLSPGARVFMADNVYVEGVGGELVQKPGEADTYKRRQLQDGTTYDVLKNYFTE